MKNLQIIFRRLLISIVIVISFQLHAQSSNADERTRNALIDYYASDREKIHLHFDKKSYLSNESIWFKGYIYNLKRNLPFINTTNVFVVLIDKNGNQIDQKLFYASNGTFTGKFVPDKELSTGEYYIQVYTNWMNNFTEDESSVFKINVTNERDNTIFTYDQIDYSKINIDLYPEGGNLINDVLNVIGIKVTDCNGTLIPLKEGEIINDKGEFVKKISLNEFGYGKFNFIPTVGETYNVAFKINEKELKIDFPQGQQKGIALEIERHSDTNETIAILRTNNENISDYIANPLTMIIHQGSKASFFKIEFRKDELKQEIRLSREYFYNGVNTIRIIDKDLNQIAERLVFYAPEAKSDLKISAKKTDESIMVDGQINYPGANLSISVVSENTSDIPKSDIYSSFFINSGLDSALSEINPNHEKIPDMNVFLLTQKGKYNWKDILGNTPRITHDFDLGLTIKGKVKQKLDPKKKHIVKLMSLQAGLDEISEVNDKNEFYFKNLIIADSSNARFTLVKMPESRYLDITSDWDFLNTDRDFSKPYKPKSNECLNHVVTKAIHRVPKISVPPIELENVTLTKNTKSNLAVLKHKNKLGNLNLKGYKIEAENNALTVLDFIASHGFDVVRFDTYKDISIKIYGRSRTTTKNQRSIPNVYLDDFKILSFQELWGMKMNDIDEIYINAHAMGSSVDNNIGIIKIYRKRGSDPAENNTPRQDIVVTNAFKIAGNYTSRVYASEIDRKNFGIIDWIPNIITDNNGNFNFKIPNTTDKTIKILIQGFTTNGEIISETKTLETNKL